MLPQTKYSFVVSLLFRLLSQLLHLFFPWFCSIFHSYLPLLLVDYFVHLLLLPGWIFFYFSLISFTNIPLLSVTFLSLISSLNFQSNFVLNKNGLILFQDLPLFSHHKYSCSVFYLQIYDQSSYIHFCQVIARWPFQYSYISTMFLS